MAVELIVQRQGPRLVGVTLSDAEAIEALSREVDYRAKITRAVGRSIKHHRLLFGLIKVIRDSYPEPLTDKAVLGALKLLTGHVEPLRLQSGQIVLIPSSINFESMDQDEFNVWFQRAVEAMCREFVPGLSKADAVREIEAIAYGRQAA